MEDGGLGKGWWSLQGLLHVLVTPAVLIEGSRLSVNERCLPGEEGTTFGVGDRRGEGFKVWNITTTKKETRPWHVRVKEDDQRRKSQPNKNTLRGVWASND